MAQTGFTPIQLYSSSTATNVPLAANLANGELAINITDGKLFYKDNAAAVQVIGWKTTPTSAGGTGLTSYTAGDTLYYASGTTLTKLAIGATDYVMTSSGSAPQWSASLKAIAGGTGQTSYAVGDLLYANTTTTLAKLADVATGNALISGGVGVAPSWGKIGLTTHVSGTLPTANGGTNLTTFTANGIVYASSTSALATGSALNFDGTNLLVGSTNNNATAGIIHGQSATDSTAVGAYAKGTTSAAVGFYCKVDSANALYAYWNCNGTPTGTISTNGTITVYGTTSDYRLKTVIGNVTGHGERIDSLKPIEYTWNSNGSSTRGFLAHEFQEVYADSVTGTKDAIDDKGNPKHQAMQAGSSEVIADLVAEIQSLRKRLAALELA
jgi:hypothetical protein